MRILAMDSSGLVASIAVVEEGPAEEVTVAEYTVNYKKTTCDTSFSPDGKYELILQAVGEPDWPFGSASGRLVLKEGKDNISQTDFELHNDGACISSSCWEVTWYEDYAEVILSGYEQFDEQVILYFDGTKNISN